MSDESPLQDFIRRAVQQTHIVIEYALTLAFVRQPSPFWITYAWRHGVDHRALSMED